MNDSKIMTSPSLEFTAIRNRALSGIQKANSEILIWTKKKTELHLQKKTLEMEIERYQATIDKVVGYSDGFLNRFKF